THVVQEPAHLRGTIASDCVIELRHNKFTVLLRIDSLIKIENGHEFEWCDAAVLHQENHFKKREIAEMYFIKRNNKAINSQKDTENLPATYDNILIHTHVQQASSLAMVLNSSYILRLKFSRKKNDQNRKRVFISCDCPIPNRLRSERYETWRK
ncbi:hypothetical protein X777_16609, partial [Ooceraea biroi]